MAALTSIFVIDPPHRLDPATDTSFALMEESLQRGHRTFFCTPAEVCLENGEVMATLRVANFLPDGSLDTTAPPCRRSLESADILHLRMNPPVDEAFFHLTWVLDRISPKTLQVNPAAALRNHCEKLIPLRFPELCVPSIVSRSTERLDAAVAEWGEAVIKPLAGCGGRGVEKVTSGAGRRAALEKATEGGRLWMQAQPFLSGARQGDKRVLLLDGTPIGWIRRVPAAGDFRSNIDAGGQCEPCELNLQERQDCERIGAWLTARGVLFAGVDLLAGKLLEVNITSPSCLREIDTLQGSRLAGRIVEILEEKLRQG